MANSQPSRRPYCLISLHVFSPIFTSTHLTSAHRLSSAALPPPRPRRLRKAYTTSSIPTTTSIAATRHPWHQRGIFQHPAHHIHPNKLHLGDTINTNFQVTPTHRQPSPPPRRNQHGHDSTHDPASPPSAETFEKIIALLGRHHSLFFSYPSSSSSTSRIFPISVPPHGDATQHRNAPPRPLVATRLQRQSATLLHEILATGSH